MSDKIIISTISKMYFIITSFLLFIFFSLSVMFIVLQYGLFIEKISIPNLKVKQLYIKWNESLDISIKEIEIVKQKSQSETSIEVIVKNLKRIPHFYNIFEKVTIDKIYYNDINAEFRYKRGQSGFLSLDSPYLSLKSSVSFEEEFLKIKINHLDDKNRDIQTNGNIVINLEKRFVTSSLFFNIHDEIYLNLLTYSNQNKTYYKINSLTDIPSITYAINLLNLEKEIQYWAHDAIKFSSLTINEVYGWFDLNDIDNSYKNIYVNATGNKLSYKYNTNLDAIHSEKTDLVFKDGVLNIYPRSAYTYKSNLNKSWLNIDFTQENELLTLKLLFDGKLDKDTHKILKEYKINIPFLQNSGVTKTDLTLKVALRGLDVDAKGSFFAKKANFRYLDFDIDVANLKVVLDNYDVNIKNMLAYYQDNIKTKVDVKFNADKGKGVIDFDIQKIDFPKYKLSLDTNKSNLKAQYFLSPKKDTIKVMNSKWNYSDYSIALAKVNIPFDLKKLTLNFPHTHIEAEDIASGLLSGEVDLKNTVFDLDFDVKTTFLPNIKLANNPVSLHLHYKDQLTITSKEKIDFLYYNNPSYLNPITLTFKDYKFSFKETYINIADIFKTKLSAEYSFLTKDGYAQTRRTRIKTDNFGLLYFNKGKTRFDILTGEDDSFSVTSKDLMLDLIKTNNTWKMNVKSLSLLSLNSAFLKRYHVTKGHIFFHKKPNDKIINLTAGINYPYHLLVEDGKLKNRFLIKGKVDSELNTISLNVNEKINIDINESVNIAVNELGVNIDTLLDIINSLDTNNEEKGDLHLNLNAKNSYLYISDDRHVLSNTIDLEYKDDILTADLVHKNGHAKFRYTDKHFDAFGENFNSNFMEQLFALSKFENGNLGFSMSGDTRKYDGIFTINNTTILEYKVLNNILAFINTVPSLVTFSIPEYVKKGLNVKTAYMKFTSEDNYFNISDIYLDSKEIKIAGKGNASFKYNTIDIDLNLKTDLGSKVSKIPLLGHILMDKDSISTTLNVSGPLNDPKITSLIAKDIVVAPLNILLRTLSLPYDLLKSIDSNATIEEEGEE